MADVKFQLNELIRKVNSEHHDPKHHGEGFVVIWDNKERKVLPKKPLLARFQSSRLEYYFIKSHTKPVMVKDVEFSWSEGTSDISLDFSASFQLKVSSRHEAEKLVALLAEVGQPDVGLHNLIDQHLHTSMTSIYDEYAAKGDNLLSEFYQHGLQKGESFKLNKTVSDVVAYQLSGSEFRIGFTLRNAPEHQVYYKHSTPIDEKEANTKEPLKVESDCRLTLNNYQAYKKSGIVDEKGIKQHMEKSIDLAIRKNILGKSTMELLSSFNNGTNGNRSISQLIKEEVDQKANLIGYELESFHTLPDIPALQLLNGIVVEFNEDDEAYKVGHFGGKVRLNIRMSVKAIEGEFEKYKHLVAESDAKMVGMEIEDIINNIKAPIRAICVEELRKYQQLDVVRDFEQNVKKSLTAAIVDNMEEQHGLAVIVKTIQPIESEDVSRLEELRGQKHTIEFNFVSKSDTEDTAEISITTAFLVVGQDIKNPSSWDAFERQDYGYRVNSPVRQKSRDGAPALPEAAKNQDEKEAKAKYDRLWKNLAIDDEIDAIKQDIVRAISNSNAFVVDVRMWLFDVKYKQKMEQQIIDDAKESVLKDRGLIIDIEPLITADEELQKAQREFRQAELGANNKRQEQRHKLAYDREDRNIKIETALAEKTTDIIEAADEDSSIDDLLEIKEKTLETQHRTEKSSKSSIADFISSGREPKQKQAVLDDLIAQQNTQEEEE